MVELDQFKYTLSTYEAPLKEVRDSLNLDAKIRRIDELDKTMEEPSFWEDAERSTRLVKEAKNLKDTVGEFNKLQNQYEEIGLLIQIADEENDASVIPEIQKMVNEFAAELESLRLRRRDSAGQHRPPRRLMMKRSASRERPPAIFLRECRILTCKGTIMSDPTLSRTAM